MFHIFFKISSSLANSFFKLTNSETNLRLPFAYFSLRFAKKTLSDGRTTTVRVGDVVNLKDDHQYRVLKIIAPSGPIVLKAIDGSTYRNFLRTPAHVLASAPQMVNQSTQTDPLPSTTDDPLARAILQCCGPDAVRDN